MKKFFSLIGLVGVFASCQPEELTTAFQVKDAELTINASAAWSSLQNDFVESEVSWSPVNGVERAGGAYLLSKRSFDGNETYSVSAQYRGSATSATVQAPRIPAGWAAAVSTTIDFPFIYEGYEITREVVGEPEVGEPVVAFFLNATHKHAYDGLQNVDIRDWDTKEVVLTLTGVPMIENLNDYILCDSYSYVEYDGEEVLEDSKDNSNTDFATAFAAHVAKFRMTEKPKEADFKVSAWSLYNVFSIVTPVTTTYEVHATPAAGSNNPTLHDSVIGTYKTVTKTVQTGVAETAHPKHGDHYHFGHGHGHGDGSNAGGGLVEAE